VGFNALLFGWLDFLLFGLQWGSGEHVVVKGSLGDGDEGAIKVMMGATNLGDEDRLGIDVGNSYVGVVGKSTNPPRN
jgi:hypothetical protein